MRFHRCFAIVMIAAGQQALAQPNAEPQPVIPIWRDIVVGDTPESVASKIMSIEGVRSASVKRTKSRPEKFKLSISYVDSDKGIPILDERFAIVPQFEGDRLTRVGLGTNQVCTNGIEQRYSALYHLLNEKYPRQIDGSTKQESYDLLRAQSSATEENPTHVTNVFSNGKTAVFMDLIFTSESRRPYPIYNNSVALALWRFTEQQYERRSAECDGTGNQRVRIIIAYMTNEDLASELAEIKSKMEDRAQKAGDKL